MRLLWETMYALPRILISAALLLAAAYGVVALVVMLAKHDGAIVALYGVPLLVAAIAIALFAHGEPSDQTAVHLPPVSPAQPLISHADWRMSDAEFDALEDEVDRQASTDEHRPQTTIPNPSDGAAARPGPRRTDTENRRTRHVRAHDRIQPTDRNELCDRLGDARLA